MGHRDGGHKAGPKTTAAAAAANVAAAREAVFASVGAGIVGAGAKGGGVLSKRGKKSQREGVQPVKAAVKASNPYDDAVGTPVYMSPEHINGAPFDRDADVWAFGCTLYETMLLAPPWVELDDGYGGMDGGMPALLKLLTTTSLDVTPLREHYPSPLCSLLGRLLHGQLSKRIPLDEFLEELGTIPLWAGASALAPAPAPDPAPAPAEAPALLDRRRRPSGEDST
jgi:serine/threonine protein kinase